MQSGLREGSDAGARPKAVLLAGPTASGKSALAMRLAESVGGIVINADSMQVYGELRILTARPAPSDEARVPHALYGHVSIREGYSVACWLADAAQALAGARAAGLVPVFTGGTGLYFKALTEGLSPMPDVPEAVRERLRARLASEGAMRLHGELAVCDPAAAARIPFGDSQRIVRALEVAEATGRPISDWQRIRREGALVDAARVRRLVVWPDRGEVRARIDARFAQMLEEGVLDEVRALLDDPPDEVLPGMRAHGLRLLMAHLRGELSLDEAAARACAETRQYAKRQTTWFRKEMADWERVRADGEPIRL